MCQVLFWSKRARLYMDCKLRITDLYDHATCLYMCMYMYNRWKAGALVLHGCRRLLRADALQPWGSCMYIYMGAGADSTANRSTANSQQYSASLVFVSYTDSCGEAGKVHVWSKQASQSCPSESSEERTTHPGGLKAAGPGLFCGTPPQIAYISVSTPW